MEVPELAEEYLVCKKGVFPSNTSSHGVEAWPDKMWRQTSALMAESLWGGAWTCACVCLSAACVWLSSLRVSPPQRLSPLFRLTPPFGWAQGRAYTRLHSHALAVAFWHGERKQMLHRTGNGQLVRAGWLGSGSLTELSEMVTAQQETVENCYPSQSRMNGCWRLVWSATPWGQWHNCRPDNKHKENENTFYRGEHIFKLKLKRPFLRTSFTDLIYCFVLQMVYVGWLRTLKKTRNMILSTSEWRPRSI